MIEYYGYEEILLALEEPIEREKYENQYDLLWKGILESTFWHFLTFMFPKVPLEWKEGCEVEFLDKELQQLLPGANGRRGVRHVDKLAKVNLKNGMYHYFLIHVEVQSTKGNGDLAKRVFEYWYRLYDKYQVPVTTVAILADGTRSYRPDRYDVSFMGTEARFKFNSYKILDQDESKLRENPNPFAVVVLTALLALKNKKVDDEQLLSIKRDLYKQMIRRDMTVDCMRGVYDFLARYVHFDNQENMLKFENQLKRDFGGDTTMGIAELLLEDVRQKAVEKKALQIASNLLKMGLPLTVIAEATGLPLEDLKKLQ
ncbi:RpnC/YadD family protein [Sphingobacterium yanglingense]|uniref:Putative transposase/invertase (TIGR01784 family) n=1 Tax=Sphingobacterium yanglingense TaxID=1437280 RepID=A0A4R6WG27_9SPHI|nr:hypothetical protein [Sphingobacterium yanglingense]TDQ79100.1 putative transposase/invertase (TIGR01784 family) [Sphingobacterium yanglingense]